MVIETDLACVCLASVTQICRQMGKKASDEVKIPQWFLCAPFFFKPMRLCELYFTVKVHHEVKSNLMLINGTFRGAVMVHRLRVLAVFAEELGSIESSKLN